MKGIQEITMTLCSNCHSIITKGGGTSEESHIIYKKYLKEAIGLMESLSRQMTLSGEDPIGEKLEELRQELERVQVERQIPEKKEPSEELFIRGKLIK